MGHRALGIIALGQLSLRRIFPMRHAPCQIPNPKSQIPNPKSQIYMKLAEALILRSDCQKKVEQLKQRLTASVKIQEGEQPPENPQALLAELDQTLNELAGLITKINKTNSQTVLQAGITLSDALAARDTLLLKRRAYEAVVEEASVRMDRYSRSEVKYYSTVNVAELQKQMDEMSKQYRELDTKIQEKNWTVDLLE